MPPCLALVALCWGWTDGEKAGHAKAKRKLPVREADSLSSEAIKWCWTLPPYLITLFTIYYRGSVGLYCQFLAVGSRLRHHNVSRNPWEGKNMVRQCEVLLGEKLASFCLWANRDSFGNLFSMAVIPLTIIRVISHSLILLWTLRNLVPSSLAA